MALSTVAPRTAAHTNRSLKRPATVRRLPVVCCLAAGKRKGKYSEAEAGQDVGRVVEEASAASHGLFNDNFKAALATALNRTGPEALIQGQERLSDEHQLSGQEELLKAGIIASRSTLLKLQMIKAEVEKAIEIEAKQVERLQFALEKARSDAAYYRTVHNMMNNSDTDY